MCCHFRCATLRTCWGVRVQVRTRRPPLASHTHTRAFQLRYRLDMSLLVLRVAAVLCGGNFDCVATLGVFNFKHERDLQARLASQPTQSHSTAAFRSPMAPVEFGQHVYAPV